jgi:Rho termination factor, N-terminal domain
MASSFKNEKVYTELRKQGDSKEKAARIANASTARGSSNVGRKGGKSGSYDDWTVPELRKRAKQLGIRGYSSKRKSELVSALRNH